MTMNPKTRHVVAALALFAPMVAGCESEGSTDLGAASSSSSSSSGAPEKTAEEKAREILDARKLDYGEALRTASLKLSGTLPTLEQIKALEGGDVVYQKTIYEGFIDTMLADTRFSDRMVAWWKDTFATGNQGTRPMGAPSFDTAATFAAMVTVEDRPYTDILTATTGTCPTYAPATSTFTPANCAGTGPVSGVLTDPGLQSQYFANMAFRRARLVQEKFACAKFPAEVSGAGTPMGAGVYTSPWDFNSITGGTTARVNFQDTSSVICANCHTTLNHVAPLFANYDELGAMTATIQVQVPIPGTPKAVLADWLPAGQQSFAWRSGKTVADIPALGRAMAEDAEVSRCAVTRAYNWAMSKGDVVNDLAPVPTTITDPYLQLFTASGLKLKAVIRAVFVADDFVKF